MNYTQKILKNGLTVVMSPVKDSPSVTVLVMVSAGSRYEDKSINGISHFLEHMCFKGTKKRPTALHISKELDSIGSQSNAFTAQEFTGYYAKAHPKYLESIMDVVSDIYINPVFDPVEIEKEKGVIIEEMNMYEDMPHRLVKDVFMETLYKDQPAGYWVIGTKDNILKMSQNDFLDYRRKHYVAEGTTVYVSGDIDEDKVINLVEKYFSNISVSPKSKEDRVIDSQTKPELTVKEKNTDQTHLVIGVKTFSGSDKRNTALKVLDSVLGGGMSSRLFQKLREEMGVGYYVRSETDEYIDHGYLSVSTGVDSNRVLEVVKAIIFELKRFTNEIVSEDELKKAKDYLVGSTFLGLESSDSIAEYYAMQKIVSPEIITPEEFAKQIQSVTSQDVMNVAKEIMLDNKLNMAIVGNIKNKEEIMKELHF